MYEGITERLDQTNALLAKLVNLMSPTSPASGGNASTTISKLNTVTVSGTAEQLPSVLIPYLSGIVIKAPETNTGTIYISNSKLGAEDRTIGFPITRGASVIYRIRNLSALWMDSTVSGEGIVWTVEQNG